MSDVLTQFLSAWLEVIGRVTWQAAIVIPIAYLIDYLWKSMPPIWRNWLWRLTFLKIALAVLPLSIPLPLLPSSAEPTTPTPAATVHLADVAVAASGPETLPSSTPYGSLLLFVVWLVGLAVCAISNWESRRQVRQKLQKSTSTQAGSLLVQHVRAISRQLGLTVIPEVRLAPGSSSPCLLARRKQSIILLPKQWLESCTMAELRLALAHELAHLSRGDLAWNRFIVWSRAVLFFHPLVWLAMRRYLLSQETACDRIAMANTNGDRADFARLLVQLAEHATATPNGAVAMIGSTSCLKERIASMYQAHHKPTRPIAWLVASVAAFSLMPFALAQQVEKEQREDPAAKKETAGPKISASASATSRGSASAGGIGAGAGMGRGNGNGDGNTRGFGLGGGMTRSRSQSRGRTSVSISTNAPQDAKAPPALPSMNVEKASSMKQSMRSQNAGGKPSWTRTTEAALNGDNITIVEKPDSIALTIQHPDATEEVFVAKNLRDLARQSRKAAAIYRKLMPPVATVPSSAGTASSTGSQMPLDARDLLRQQIESMKDGQGTQDAMLDRLLNELDALGN